MFKLTIECTKDIDKLQIDFSDGTSCVTTSPKNVDVPKSHNEIKDARMSRSDKFLDLDAEFGGVSQEIVELPDVTKVERSVKVAPELQNLDL